MKRPIIAALAIFVSVPCYAQHPPNAVQYSPVTASDQIRICSHLAAAYPGVHVQVGAPGVLLDCSPGDTRAAFHVSYDSVTSLLWLASRPGKLMPD